MTGNISKGGLITDRSMAPGCDWGHEQIIPLGPASVTHEADNVHIEWETEKHLAGLDFWADGSLEWFFMGRTTGHSEGSDGRVSELPDCFVELISVFPPGPQS